MTSAAHSAGDKSADTEKGTRPPLDVSAAFDGVNILLIGSTGFVGKVVMSMLLRHYPNVGKVFALVRPGMGNTAEDRFFKRIATSPAFDPLREAWGDGYDSFMHEKVVPIPGDIGRPLCNFTDEQFEKFEAAGGLDVIINSAGLVSFTPSLESALRINTMGAKNCLEAARRAKAKLVHVSTCFVFGRRNGEAWEDEQVVGYFPRHEELYDDDFDALAEVEDCHRVIAQVRERANDRRHISEFREAAVKSLEEQRRDPDNANTLRLAVARERKIWVHEQLTELGVQRAHHWGWTNTYTYTKSLGEQLIMADDEVVSTIVRPAIVESSVSYPSPGWNEGFNTTAPLVYLMLKGHRQVVAGKKTALDIIPVDYVAGGMLAATAAILTDQHERIYQLCSSDLNPVSARRLAELSGLVIRRHYRRLADEGINPIENRIRARLEAFPVSKRRFELTSAPQFRRLADALIKQIDERVPTWGAPRLIAFAERAKDELAKVSDFSGRVTDLMEMFAPFTNDYDIAFRADNIRALHARLTPQDQQALPWGPHDLDWRAYWFDDHFEGLKKWVFPVLDDEFGPKLRSVYTYKDLLELFDSATKLHRHRVAMRLLPTGDDDSPPVVYTYERVQDVAQQCAGNLRERGVEAGDHVLLMSENRPEWGISYFGILKASATAVPIDSQLSMAEVANLVRASGAKVSIISIEVAERLLEDEDVDVPEEMTDAQVMAEVSRLLDDAGVTTQVVEFEDVLVEPAVSAAPLVPIRRGDAVASLIYTSGTTGDPKGVMLTHKNLTSMASRLSSLFHLYRHDGLLSVLPLHHTFEFTAGLLMPLIHGSHITYLEEVSPEGLNKAFETRHITGMIGVPALWQLLHRKIFKRVADGGPLVQRAFELVVDLNRWIRDSMPYEVDLGKLIFFPVHRALGGRMRLMISGGSALSPDVMKSFRGLGFKLYEGYGMTEASPVIAAQRPGEAQIVGSVGRALPGVDLRIDDANENGVGEVVAKGPNIMKGYYQNESATKNVLREGWLHTGDLGRLDEDGNLYIVGRMKEMILGASGENVYPDELEEIYGDCEYVKELSVVGLPAGEGIELVAMLVVPDYEHDVDRETIRQRVREHVRTTSHKLPLYKRVKVFHLWEHDLPKTTTRKIKRREVLEELLRLDKLAASGASAKKVDGARSTAWVRDIVAQVAQKQPSMVSLTSRLEALGFDSLMFTELGVALEGAGVILSDPSSLTTIETVADLEKFVATLATAKGKSKKAVKKDVIDDSDDIRVPKPFVNIGRRGLRLGQRMLYERVFDTSVTGSAYIPPFGGYIVAANHSSHLDMGLVKHALRENGEQLVALAAKDYFFEDPIRRMYFENFTNLVPMERHGSLRESLRLAGEILREGYILLIFPEGTRSETGVMIDFKPSLGYLALANKCGILPMYLAGTYDGMPKGAMLPKPKNHALGAHAGPFYSYESLVAMSGGLSRAASYREIAKRVETTVRAQAPADYEWTLGESGRLAVVDYEVRS